MKGKRKLFDQKIRIKLVRYKHYTRIVKFFVFNTILLLPRRLRARRIRTQFAVYFFIGLCNTSIMC